MPKREYGRYVSIPITDEVYDFVLEGSLHRTRERGERVPYWTTLAESIANGDLVVTDKGIKVAREPARTAYGSEQQSVGFSASETGGGALPMVPGPRLQSVPTVEG